MKIGISNGSVVTLEEKIIKIYPSLSTVFPIITDRTCLNELEFNELNDLPPLELPIKSSKIICLAKNYAAHAKEMGVEPKDLPKNPSLFLKPASALIGPNENIIIPPQTQQVHHEVELAVIIGKEGKNIPLEDSLSYIFGYSILLDITARDIQSIAKKDGRPWFEAKGFDTFSPIGPVIVTSDEISNPQNLDLELKLNGVTKQRGNTKDMIFKIDQIINYCSSIVTLEPGDIIATGTPDGVGPFKKGDRILATIESIGTLKLGVA
jgi:2-keto-4-pentenoate hydratase/2-oxohepta-3-ene-1,7-dioic acid hydratase in catechol pathway